MPKCGRSTPVMFELEPVALRACLAMKEADPRMRELPKSVTGGTYWLCRFCYNAVRNREPTCPPLMAGFEE